MINFMLSWVEHEIRSIFTILRQAHISHQVGGDHKPIDLYQNSYFHRHNNIFDCQNEDLGNK